MSESSKFWVSREGQNYGPYSLEELKTYVEQGHFCGEDSACEAKEGANWKSVGDFISERERTARLDESDFHKGSSSSQKSAALDERDFYSGTPQNLNRTENLTNSNGSEEKSKSYGKLWMSALVVIFALAGVIAVMRGTKVSINPVQILANNELQSKIEEVIDSDYRNTGIEISVYYRDAFSKSVAVFDIQKISGSKSRLDMFRVLLKFAEKMKDSECDTVELACRGKSKFKLDGSYLRKLGRELDFQNPTYTIRTFPQNVKTILDIDAYPKWSGGVLGVLNKQMEDFNDFHDKWYLDELNFTY
jgi:hypothetical protein